MVPRTMITFMIATITMIIIIIIIVIIIARIATMIETKLFREMPNHDHHDQDDHLDPNSNDWTAWF